MRDMRLAAVLCAALWLSPATAKMQETQVPETHSVVSGDTLWDISETYFESPYEWPRLWSYNPEITNPHWIYPDSVVRLRPADGSEPAAPAPVEMEPTKPPEPTGIYLRDLGFLDADAVKHAGTIVAAREEHMMMSPSDVVYLRLNEGAKPRIGGRYTIYRLIKSSEREKGEKGRLVRLLGEVRLLDYDEDKQLGHAEIMEASERPSCATSALSRRRRQTSICRPTWWPRSFRASCSTCII